MIIGFTGTRSGMSAVQTTKFWFELGKIMGTKGLKEPFVFIHGGCIGADIDFHKAALKLKAKYGMNITIEVYPGHSTHNPENMSHRGDYSEADIVHESQSHFKRNRDIVNRSDIMFATPYHTGNAGGTWYTIHYAEKVGKKTKVIKTL